MAKNIIISINSKDGAVITTPRLLGINNENIAGEIIVEFFNGDFVDGAAQLEIQRGAEKGFLSMTQDAATATYRLPIKSSLLSIVGKIKAQIVIKMAEVNGETPTFKSQEFALEVKEAVNATETIPDTYPTWYEKVNNSIPTLQDLTATDFTPVENTYYKHTGATTAEFTQGIIYFYDGAVYKAINGGGGGGATGTKLSGSLPTTGWVEVTANVSYSYTISNSAIRTNSFCEMFLTDSGMVKEYSKTDGSLTVIRDAVPTSEIPYELQIIEMSTEGEFKVINDYLPDTHSNLPVTYKKLLSTLNSANWDIENNPWSASTLPSSADWYSVTYGDGKFVAVAIDSSNAAYSTDGISWSASTLPSNEVWRSVAYGNGKFVAVASGKAAYSTDGISWSESTLPSSAGWRSVTYGNGKFVAVASGSSNAAYSTDGISWSESTLPSSADWYSVTYGDGKFVAVAQFSSNAAYSTDGISWSASTLPNSVGWSSVTYGNGKFVAVAIGSSNAAYSTDGISWSASALPTYVGWRSVTYGDGKFVVVANNSSNAAYSTDGISWSAGTLPRSAYWQSVTYGDGKFVAVVDGSSGAAYWIATTEYTQSITDTSILVNSAVKAFLTSSIEIIAKEKTAGSVTFSTYTLPTADIPVTLEIAETSSEGVFEIINSYTPTFTQDDLPQTSSKQSVSIPNIIDDWDITWSSIGIPQTVASEIYNRVDNRYNNYSSTLFGFEAGKLYKVSANLTAQTGHTVGQSSVEFTGRAVLYNGFTMLEIVKDNISYDDKTTTLDFIFADNANANGYELSDFEYSEGNACITQLSGVEFINISFTDISEISGSLWFTNNPVVVTDSKYIAKNASTIGLQANAEFTLAAIVDGVEQSFTPSGAIGQMPDTNALAAAAYNGTNTTIYIVDNGYFEGEGDSPNVIPYDGYSGIFIASSSTNPITITSFTSIGVLSDTEVYYNLSNAAIKSNARNLLLADKTNYELYGSQGISVDTLNNGSITFKASDVPVDIVNLDLVVEELSGDGYVEIQPDYVLEIPTKTSELTNDSGFITQADKAKGMIVVTIPVASFDTSFAATMDLPAALQGKWYIGYAVHNSTDSGATLKSVSLNLTQITVGMSATPTSDVTLYLCLIECEAPDVSNTYIMPYNI